MNEQEEKGRLADMKGGADQHVLCLTVHKNKHQSSCVCNQRLYSCMSELAHEKVTRCVRWNTNINLLLLPLEGHSRITPTGDSSSALLFCEY